MRLIVLDSRAARVLDPDARAMLDPQELAWLDAQMQGGFKHLLIGTSLPFLLPPGLHHLEAWNEAVAGGAWGERLKGFGEWARQTVDLEHWAAWQRTYQQVADMATEVADGRRGPAPDTVTFLSGDVHHSYVSEVRRRSGSPDRAGRLLADPQPAAAVLPVPDRRAGLRHRRADGPAGVPVGARAAPALHLAQAGRAVVRQRDRHAGGP